MNFTQTLSFSDKIIFRGVNIVNNLKIEVLCKIFYFKNLKNGYYWQTK